MDEDILVIIVSTLTVLAGMTSVLVGLNMWLRARAQRLGSSAREEIEHLKAAMAELRSEVEHQMGELSAGQQELHERIDFAERLLSRGKGPPT